MTKTIDVKVPPEFWASSIMPEGVVEQWLRPDGSEVEAGDPVAAIRVESMLHQLPAPGAGVLRVLSRTNSVVDPGYVIGRIVLRYDA
jgi:pyruvate/2-oxoglutarate dehydrogenase complex dihydrolipoamide acyltransferase (E2) component